MAGLNLRGFKGKALNLMNLILNYVAFRTNHEPYMVHGMVQGQSHEPHMVQGATYTQK
jgi:hypothetical protein